MTQNPSMADTIDQFRAGNDALLPRVFGHFRPRLREMVRLRIGGQLAARVDPSDVLQEAFVDASEKMKRYLLQPDVSVFVWLRGVTRDRLHKLQRTHLGAECRTADREVSLPTDASAAFATQLARGPTASQQFRRAALHESVQRAMAQLKETDREVILMRHFEGLSNNQVAEALAITAAGATQRHGRALARLKSVLECELSCSKDRKP